MSRTVQNVSIVVDRNSATITFTKAEGSTRTEIDKFWVNGESTYDEYTNGNGFLFENLSWGMTYQFRLRSFFSDGSIAETEVFSFKIEDGIVPTVASNVVVSVEKNSATINFTKGAGVRTYINMSWVDGIYELYTAGTRFFLENLPWGLNGTFTLITRSNTGEEATSQAYSIVVEEGIIPTVPTNVKVVVDKNSASISFNKGAGVRTYINKSWEDGVYDQYTTGNGFFLENLPWGLNGTFTLITRSNTGEEITSQEYSFKIEDGIVPTVATNVTVAVEKNIATIKFTKGAGVRTYINKSWVDGVYDEYTTGNGFVLENLPWGLNGTFTLITRSNTGEEITSQEYSLNIEVGIVPTVATNVTVAVDKNVATIKFTKGAGVRTYINKSWVDGVYDEYTSGSAFILDSLPWGLNAKFTLITRSNTGEEITSQEYSFKIEDEIIPTPPTGISVVVFNNNAEVKFTKGAGIRTYIDKLWVNGEGTYEEYTVSGNVFYLNALPWGTTYNLRLASMGNTGLIAKSEIISFTIVQEIIPTIPTNIVATVFKNNAQISFTKGNAVRTYLDKLWVNGEGTFEEYTINGTVFYLDNLEWGKHYEFKLRSTGNSGLVADTGVLSFDIEPAIGPTLPQEVQMEVIKNTCSIKMVGQEGVRFEIAKEWDGGLDSFVQYTTGNGFYFENLAWGTEYRFKIKVISNTGATLTSSIYSFTTVENPVPLAPTEIVQVLGEKNVTIRFKKGNGERTKIACSWLDGISNFNNYTFGESFFFENLPSNSKLQYVLRTIAIDGVSYADSEVRTFYTPI